MSADIRFLYDQVIEHLVRLTWFATSADIAAPDSVSEEIDHVAELLAKRDLLVFAASLRNFAEATNSVTQMKEVSARLSEVNPKGPDFHRESLKSINLHQALSRILHSQYITIVRQPVLLLKWEEVVGIDPKTWENNLEHPLVRFTTSQDGDTLVRIDAVVGMSCQYLAKMLDILGKKIMLSRVDRDF